LDFGLQERNTLGVVNLSEQEMQAMMVIDDPETLELRRPKNVWINLIIVLVAIGLLVEGSVPSAIIFMLGTVITLLVNYPNPKNQKAPIDRNASEANQVLISYITMPSTTAWCLSSRICLRIYPVTTSIGVSNRSIFPPVQPTSAFLIRTTWFNRRGMGRLAEKGLVVSLGIFIVYVITAAIFGLLPIFQ